MAYFKYQRVADSIRNDIVKSVIKNQLPTELELTTQYQVSNITIKKAIAILKSEDVVYTKQGSGVYVNTIKKNILTSNYKKQHRGFKTEHTGQHFKTDVLSFELIKCPIKIAAYLSIAPGQSVYFIKRLRSLNDIPNRIEYTYIPHHLVPNLTTQVCKNSIYQYILDELNCKILKTHDYFFISDP